MGDIQKFFSLVRVPGSCPSPDPASLWYHGGAGGPEAVELIRPWRPVAKLDLQVTCKVQCTGSFGMKELYPRAWEK